MGCSSCGIACLGKAMIKCDNRCGYGCYSGTGNGGGTSCSQMCVGICVGECAGQHIPVGPGSRCIGCQTHCDDSCTGACIQANGFDTKDGSLECVKDGSCNVQCSNHSGGSHQSGFCNQQCMNYCNTTQRMFTQSTVDQLCYGSSGQIRCLNKCNSTCWDTCVSEGCTHSCSTSECRLLCTELEELNGGSGIACKGCSEKCDDNSGSSTDGGECGTCWGTCTDSCSENSSCDHKCMNECNVLCDDNCDRVCIEECSDHCTYSCSSACSGCDNYCTACDQSCQEACIVTCSDQCSACREKCSGMTTSETECMKMCRSCTSMCVDTCVNSCITWNSSGTQLVNNVQQYISNATFNDWRGFTESDAPRDGNQWYGPTTNGFDPKIKNWNTIVNKYPTKPSNKLPLGYGAPYTGIIPANNVGSSDGSRGDWDYFNPGEYEWYNTSRRSDDDVDWDMIRKL